MSEAGYSLSSWLEQLSDSEKEEFQRSLIELECARVIEKKYNQEKK